ncbi:MAG: tyrosine-type recombinase/integrase [Gammaproteobacteria bacterium]|nr:tyrosine-type recombinase/integrase [Gammaproteobacteria bacterium]
MTSSNRTVKPLTAAVVRAHKSGTIADASPNRGLRLRANRSGSKTWLYRYKTFDDRLREITLGHYPTMELAEARTALAEQKKLREAHQDPKDARRAKREAAKAEVERAREAGYLVETLINQYLAEHVDRNRANPNEPRRLMKRDVVPVIGQLSVSEIRRHHVHELVQGIAARAPRVASMIKTELHAAFEHALSAGRVPMDFVNPAIGVKAPPQKRRHRALGDPELARFQKWLPESNLSKSIQDALSLILLTGCRGGEVVSARWEDIDLDNGEWRLPETKNSRPHTVYLSRQAIGLLASRRDEHKTWVFPSPSGTRKDHHIHQRAIVWALYKERGHSGLAHFTGHDLRRSAGTGLARLGCPRVVQDRILNHADTSIGAIYDRYTYDREAKDWWQRWADQLESLTAPGVMPMVNHCTDRAG